MGRVKVTLNLPGVKSMLNDAGVRAELTKRMERVESAAKAAAPYDPKRKEGQHYRDSIEVVQDSTDRVAVRVIARAEHSMILESRTGNLSRALDAAGGRRA